ncbi:DUF6933 domain-containing protein [Pelomicrobium methylotrophicum]
MVTLRPTRKLQSALPPMTAAAHSDTALGDWYVNRLVVDQRPLLLLVSSTSLLPILLPARDVRTLPNRLADVVAERLARLGIASSLIRAETSVMSPVHIDVTIDRSVLGIMVDFAKAVPYFLEVGAWDEASLLMVEDRLSERPCHAGKASDRVILPYRKTSELLAQKWAG